ncbi:MAG: PSD1 and planctomycete cytochrome C domain-containing protein [Planctomycetota bacterium]
MRARAGQAPAKGNGPAARPLEAGPATPEDLEFFEQRIRPVLESSCYSCHSSGARRIRAGLVLDSRHGFLMGGDTGTAMVPGDPDASAFIQAIRWTDEDFAMPPKERLSDEQIADFETWVRKGAPWPAESGGTMETIDSGANNESLNRHIDLEAGREFWAFQPVVRPEVPESDKPGWVQSPIDAFLLQAMAAAGVQPVEDADDTTWLRRVTFDLTGLPPKPEDLAAFRADRSADRDEKVVDRLLASPEYAERWGRHWLDVARYGESSGKEQNVLYPHAWRYRDWVLKAFAEDLPYDRFLKLQIAGDLVYSSDETEGAWNRIATGYLALGTKGHANRDERRFQLDMVDEQIDAMSQGMLGLTVSCARCHDHKFDPIPTEDYYALAGILMSSETHYGTMAGPGNLRPSDLLPLPAGADLPNGPQMQAGVRQFLEVTRDRLDRTSERARDNMEGQSREDRAQTAFQQRRQRDQLRQIENLLTRFGDDGKALVSNRLAMGMSEGKARDIAVLERGELDRPGNVVPRGVPQVLQSGEPLVVKKGSGRLQLADWVASKDNPLTARVWVNRVWLHLFGAGIVPTPDNFGNAGQRPTHPELLDWLASEFMEKGWSTKALLRELTLSHTYRLASRSNTRGEEIDPDLRTLWRMPKRRLEAEALRDSMLVAAGTLKAKAPVGAASGTLEGLLRAARISELLLQESPVRSVYLTSLRGMAIDSLEVFDAPGGEFVKGDRDETTVPTQALLLMNNEKVLELSDAFADRLLAIEGKDSDRIETAFLLALGREPSSNERKLVAEFLKDYANAASREGDMPAQPAPQGRPGRDGQGRRPRPGRNLPGGRPAAAPKRTPEQLAWSAFAQSLFQGAEFRIIG